MGIFNTVQNQNDSTGSTELINTRDSWSQNRYGYRDKEQKNKKNSLVENKDHNSDKSNSNESSRDQEYGHGAIMLKKTQRKKKK